MRAADHFHVGIVVDDLASALIGLTEELGYEWCQEIAVAVPVRLPAGDREVELRFAYSRSTPRLELIQSVPGSPWVPASGSGIHHLGYWSDDVAADAARLEARGHITEATGIRSDASPSWAYLRRPGGPRLELVSRELEPGLQGYWEMGAGS